MKTLVVVLCTFACVAAHSTELDDLWAELNANSSQYESYMFTQSGITYIGISWGNNDANTDTQIDDYYEFNADGSERYFGFLGVTYAQWDTMRRNYNQGLCHTFTVCDPNKFWSLLVY
ncbi:MAG: hypothetical protein AAF545_02220 [Pseudomonadota bacterium]